MKKTVIAIIIFFILPSCLFAREFLNTYVHLNLGGMYTSFINSDLLDSEENRNESYFSDYKSATHYETAFCATLDVVPMKPIILGLESHAIKFGVRGSYRLHFMEQRVSVADEEYENRLINYKSWMIGPVVHYAPFLESSYFNNDYTASSGFTFYVLYGRLDGDLTSGQAIENAGGSISGNSTDLSGYKIDVGFGAELAVCSVNFGANIYYSYINMDFDKAVYSDLGKSTTMNEFCLEIYIGIPVESFIEPLIPRF